MWTSEHRGTTSASPEAVYALWADVSSWPRWNSGVASIDIDGPFRAGAQAIMHFPDGSALPFRLTWTQPELGYEDLTNVPDAGVQVRVRHEAVATESPRTVITYRCHIEGTSPEACQEVGEQVSSDFDEVIVALAAAAEQ